MKTWPTSTRWLAIASFVFAALAGISAVQLRSQVPAVNATGCNVISCATDADCQYPHPLCAACQSDYGGPNECSTIKSGGPGPARGMRTGGAGARVAIVGAEIGRV